MKTIYIDSNFKCHVANADGMAAVETDFFDGKCDAYIEGYCYDIENGAIYPWVDHNELERIQQEYDQQLVATYEEALRTVGVEV